MRESGGTANPGPRPAGRARPVTPLPRRGRTRRAAKAVLRAILLPLCGAVASTERRLRGFAKAPRGPIWPHRESPRTALLVRLDLLGDCLLTLPAAAALKRAHPGIHITFLAARGSGELLRLSPAVDAVIECDLAELTHLRAMTNFEGWRAGIRLLAELRRSRFDLAIAAYGPLARGLVALSLARHRIADGIGHPALDRQRSIRSGEHEIDHLLDLVCGSSALPPGATIDPPEPPPGLAGAVVLCPGTRSGSAKAWPTGSWRRLAAGISDRGRKTLVVGAAGDAPLADAICASGPDLANLAGKLSLRQLAGVIARARLVIGVDSMPMHMAALLGVPVLGLFGPTDSRRYGPRGSGRALEIGIGCSPCYDQRAPPECPFGDRLCMTWLDPARVLAEARGLADV